MTFWGSRLCKCTDLAECDNSREGDPHAMILHMRRIGALLFGCTACVLAALAGPCDRLAALAIPHATITSSATMISGPNVFPGENTGLERSLPEFCKVDAVTDSKVKIEVWLPTEDQWNGKFLVIGEGGMESGLGQGYAIARAHEDVHSITEAAAVIVRSFYGRAAEHFYFTGCSNGGVQALTEAEHFPGDYDGIVAGASKKTAIPDLRPFQRRGGKLLVYEGSVDLVAPPNANAEFFRLFLVPGLTHCADLVGALNKWVSEGVAPEKTLNPSIARRIR
jgi:hypothetical protein